MSGNVSGRDDAFAPATVRALFDENAETYDRVNTIVSLGLDASWREWAAEQAAERMGARVLDAFAGTGRTGVRAAEYGAEVTVADLSFRMLTRARARAKAHRVRVRPLVADVADPDAAIPGAPYDAITAVFGIRYLADPSAAIARLGQLLGKDGRLVIVEFVDPEGGGPITRGARFYFMRILPKLASAIAGHRELYERLVSSTRAIRGPQFLEQLVRDAGLEIVETHSMGFGMVEGVVARPVREAGATALPAESERLTPGRP